MIRFYTTDGGFVDVDTTMDQVTGDIGKLGGLGFIRYREGAVNLRNVTTIEEIE